MDRRFSKKEILTVAAISIMAVAVIFIYFRFDPTSSDLFPKCPSKLITGYNCPGCGSQRAIHALLHGNISEAIRQNAILIVALPFLGILGIARIIRLRYPRFYLLLNSNGVIYSVLIVVFAWTIIRNLLGI